MHTLILRLAGPMQSWGVQSRFVVRDTGLEPSKSGVVGLLCAALGRPRIAPIEDLTVLHMGVRVDQEGNLKRDYHTAQNVYKAAGGKPKDTEVSTRYYLADAAFLVGVQCDDDDLLHKLHSALRNPHWPLYLGRKAFVPGEPVYVNEGLREGTELIEALRSYPWLGRDKNRYLRLKRENPNGVRAVVDDRDGVQVRPDMPLSFAERRFAQRRITTRWLEWPPYNSGGLSCTSPD